MIDPRLRRHEFGFLELSERPSDDDLEKYYAQSYYQTEKSNYRKNYSDDELLTIRLRVTQRATRASDFLGHYQKGKLLDVGCGEGFVMAEYAQKGWDVLGIDFSTAGIEAMNPSLLDRVLQGNIFSTLLSLIASKQTYNLVWLGNVLEHVVDPVSLLVSLRQLVSKNGLLVVTVPNDGSVLHEHLFNTGAISHRFWIAIPDHISYFTAESLHTIAAATGWQALDILGDFPVDLFLAHSGSNYIRDPIQGPDAHSARIQIEKLIGQAGDEAANRFYSALASVGLGRNLTAFLKPMPLVGSHS